MRKTCSTRRWQATGALSDRTRLLAERYATDEGNHRTGDRIFGLVVAADFEVGDREVNVVATHAEYVPEGTNQKLVGKWRKDRTVIEVVA